MKKLLLLPFLLASLHAQLALVRFDSSVTAASTLSASGGGAPLYTMPRAIVSVCGTPQVGAPCTNYAPLYADQAGTQPIPNPILTDAQGRFGFFASAGNLVYTVQSPSGTYLNSYFITLSSLTSGINATPGTSQTILQPSGTTLNVTSLNQELTATLYPGADIGAQVNTAITVLNGCGTINIPAGTYAQTTTIKKPRCVNIRGQNGYGTTLNWTPLTGAAMVLADQGSSSPTLYAPDEVADISFQGSGSTHATVGVFIGGDPASVYAPAGAFGDFQSLNRVRISGFGQGITVGSNAYRDDFFESMITGNGIGFYYLSTSVNSGEAIGFTNSNVQNSDTYGIDLEGYGDFYFVSSSCDYNGVFCLYVDNAASVSFIGGHIEQATTPMINVNSVPDPHMRLNLTAMQLTYTGPATATPVITMAQRSTFQYGSLMMNGGEVNSNNALGAVVAWNLVATANQQIYNGVRTDPTVAFLTTKCGLGCNIVNEAGTVSNGSAVFQNLNNNGVRYTPSADSSNVELFGTNAANSATTWSMDALGNLTSHSLTSLGPTVSAMYSPLTGTTAPSGDCTAAGSGTLRITADGHGTYCHASTLVWTTLY